MRRLIAPFAALALLAACDAAEPPVSTPAGESTTPERDASDQTATEPVSCLDERGQDAAQQLADQCRQVSPATRPPCNVANPCAMIQAEIDRSCALWAEDGDAPEECGA